MSQSQFPDNSQPASPASPPPSPPMPPAMPMAQPVVHHLHYGAVGDNVPVDRIVAPLGRFGAYLLDGLLSIVTLGIGWLIWACFTAGEGQTPARKLLGHRVHKVSTGQPATFGNMLLMRGIIGATILSIAIGSCFGAVLVFMPLWDDRSQTLVDKISGTVVLRD